LDHAIGGFAQPVLAREFRPFWGADSSGSRHEAVSLVKKIPPDNYTPGEKMNFIRA